MEFVPCRLSHLLLDEQRDHVVFLRSLDGSRRLDFLIGPTEAAAITRYAKGERFARPLTHDLIAGVLEALGASLSGLRIVTVVDGTYYAEIVLTTAEGQEVAIDCRPSDGLALLALHPDTELLVADDLLE